MSEVPGEGTPRVDAASTKKEEEAPFADPIPELIDTFRKLRESNVDKGRVGIYSTPFPQYVADLQIWAETQKNRLDYSYPAASGKSRTKIAEELMAEEDLSLKLSSTFDLERLDPQDLVPLLKALGALASNVPDDLRRTIDPTGKLEASGRGENERLIQYLKSTNKSVKETTEKIDGKPKTVYEVGTGVDGVSVRMSLQDKDVNRGNGLPNYRFVELKFAPRAIAGIGKRAPQAHN